MLITSFILIYNIFTLIIYFGHHSMVKKYIYIYIKSSHIYDDYMAFTLGSYLDNPLLMNT